MQENVVELPIGLIERGFYQPREYFDPVAMEATLRSIREKGQKYPVIVRPILMGNPLFDPQWDEPHYELADGERRYRCCKELGFETLKALIRSLTDEEMLDYTLTTNDSLPLNPIERAMVFSRLAKEFGKSQVDIAASFSLKQQQVSEYIRLLELPKEIQDLTARAVISVRHARELLKIQDSEKMKEMAFAIQKDGVTTRELTKILKNSKKKPSPSGEKIALSDIFIENEQEASKKSSQQALPTAPVGQVSNSRDDREGLSHENGHFVEISSSFWIEQLQRKLIPSKIYQRMEVWLSFDLGSRLRPEVWLLRVELALILGAVSSILTVWMPAKVLGIGFSMLVTLLFYLYMT